MRNREHGTDRARWVGALILTAAVAAFVALTTGAFDIRDAGAYEQWSVDRTSGACFGPS